MKYQKTDQGLFPNALSIINGLRKCPVVPEMPSTGIRTKPWVLLMAAVMFAFVSVAIFTPRTADARQALLSNYVANHPGTKLANLCGNCHVDWSGGGIGNAERIDAILFDVSNMPPAVGSQFYLNDQDMDGASTGTEFTNSQSATRPALPTKWFPSFPDKDGDGCLQLLNNLGESGTYQAPINLDSDAYLGAGNGFISYAPQGWDVDDNDSTQGCSTPWPTSASSGTFNNPGVTTDATPPAAITDLRAIINANSGVIPLVWTSVGDDGITGNAHDYDIRYMANPATIVAGRNPRLAADWATMYSIAEDQMGIPPSATWNKGTGLTPLMRAMYEPVPSVTGATQTCNALGYSPLCTANAGASYVLGSKGSAFMTNVIANGATYWLAVRTSDGVVKPSGTLTAPGSISENATLSNIIAVTAGPAGTTATSGMAISTISPTTLTGSTTVTVTGFGLNLNANQVVNMYLTNSAGTAVAVATSLTSNGTALTGAFTFPIPNGIYNLELRNGTSPATTKAARVNAVTVSGGGDPPPPTVTSVTPNSRGQGALNQCIQISGTNFYNPLTVSFGAGITVNSYTVNSPTSVTVCISISSTATTGTRNISVTANGQPSNTVPFTVTPAPVIGNPPPNGTYGVGYSYTCTATGGVPPYTWSMTGVPPGLIFDANNCQVTGTPTVAGTFVGSLTVTDSNGGRSSIGTSIIISATLPGAPTIGTATAGDAQATVTFTPPASNGGVTITSYTATSSPGGISGNCAASPCTVSGLTNGTAYTFTVTATNAVGTGPTSAASNSVTPVVSTPPDVDLVMTSVSTSTTSVATGTMFVIDSTEANIGTTNMTAANNLVTFYLSLDNVITTSDIELVASRTVTALAAGASSTASTSTFARASTPSGTYYLGACADVTNLQPETNETNNCFAGGTIAIVTITTVPGAPTIGMATAGNAQATVTFTPPASNGGSAITSYTATSTPGGITGACTASPCTVTGLTNGTAYTFTVTATNAVGNSPASAASNSVTPGANASDIDLVMTAVSTTTTSVATGTMFVIDSTETNIGTANMTAANNIVSFYLSLDNMITTSDIELVASRTVTALAAGASSTASTSTFARAATPSGTYYVGACADVSNLQPETNETNNCLASAATITIIGSVTVPGAPTIGTATAGNASASVAFTAPVNNGGSAITSFTATSAPGGMTGTCTASPCTVTGLTNGTAYTFTVTATNSAGTGAASAPSNSVIPLENVPPSVPTKLTATAFSTTQINLTWRASTDNVGVTGYKVYRNDVQVGTPTGTSYSDTGLTVATSYQYRVAACDAAGNCSAQSSAVTGTTKRK